MKWNRSGPLLALMLVASTVRAANLTDSWSSAVSGFWNDPSKWSLNAFPNNGGGNTYSVVVAATGNAYTLSLTNAYYTVNDLSLNSASATFDLTGGSLSVVNSAFNLAAGTLLIDGGTISGGSINQNGGTLKFTSTGGQFVNNASIVGSINLSAASANTTFYSGADFTGSATLSGSNSDLYYAYNATLGSGRTINLADSNSEVYIERNFNAGVDDSLTIASGATIRGKGYIGSYGGSSNSLTSNGLISADQAGNYLYVQPQLFTNTGTLQALNGATLLVNSANWSNSGTFVVDSSSTLTLGGTFTLGSTGFNNVIRPGGTGGTINISGFANNTGNTINIPAAAGTVRMFGGTINGGTVSESGGSLSFTNSGGTLSGNAVLAGNLVITDSSGNASLFSGGDFTGNATLSGSNSALYYGYNATLGAGKTINLADSNSEVYIERNFNAGVDDSLTVASGATIRGKGYIGSYGGSSNSLTNNGLISADLAGNYLYVQPQLMTNNGTLQALNGATLLINGGSWSNNGTFVLDSTSTLTLGGP